MTHFASVNSFNAEFQYPYSILFTFTFTASEPFSFFSVSCTAQYETRKPARSCTRYLHLQQRERIGQKKRKNGSNIELNDESLFSFSDLFRVALLFAFNNSKRGNRYMDGVLTWLLHSIQHRRFEIMHPSDRTVLIQELHSFHSNSIHT